ncbi:MAG: aspartate/glutamate racemase family protein, partial [Rothia dentocariosa]
MKTLGIIGGMSPESTALYYRIINREVNRRLGGNHSADIVMHSVDFEEVVRLQKSGDWEAAGVLLAASAVKLEGAGAQLLLVATNTMHKVAPAIERATTVPLLHVVDATATAIQRQGLQRVGLLGTTFTMSDGFYTKR